MVDPTMADQHGLDSPARTRRDPTIIWLSMHASMDPYICTYTCIQLVGMTHVRTRTHACMYILDVGKLIEEKQ
jgi:hypothetical protein